MQTRISTADGAALHGCLVEVTGDIVVRVDELGFIETASANISEIGYDLSELLLKPHVADLAASSYSGELRRYVDRILSGRVDENSTADWREFPIGQPPSSPATEEARPKPWYALSLRAVLDDQGVVIGGVGLLRSVDQKRALEDAVHNRALVDPLTGLANRHAFCSALRRQLAAKSAGSLAIFEIDRMRAVFMQYGQRTADEIIWGFAKFLETMVNGEHELAQFDGDRFCVILVGMPTKAALRWTDEVLKTFSALTLTTTSSSPRLSASAGLACIEGSVDATLRQAELALVMARARGGMQAIEAPASRGLSLAL